MMRLHVIAQKSSSEPKSSIHIKLRWGHHCRLEGITNFGNFSHHPSRRAKPEFCSPFRLLHNPNKLCTLSKICLTSGGVPCSPCWLDWSFPFSFREALP